MRTNTTAALAVLSTLATGIAGAEDILDSEYGVQRVASTCQFTEGPAVDRKGNLFFSDGPNDRIMKLSYDGELSVFLKPCGAANGLLFDHEGRLLMCQSSRAGGARAVARWAPGQQLTTLTSTFRGKRYIAPNDLTVDRRGRIYFTDPYYDGEKSQPTSGVYRLDPNGEVTLVIDNLLKPNGIVITPDNKTLYVSDRGTQKLHRYRVTDQGTVERDEIAYSFFPDRGIDGMCLDVQGNIYGAAGQNETTGLFVISPSGQLLLHKPMPEFSTNVTFGGTDMRDLYLTATTSVYKMRTRHAGAKLPPRLAGN